MRRHIHFLRRGAVIRLTGVAPHLTLLDYLRLHEGATGTKEGCAEGDCGACTVVLRRRVGDNLVYDPVNACIVLAGQADGVDLIAVEDLARDGSLHPVQQALADFHGSQCGFCTPGFVMSLFALYHAPSAPPPGTAGVSPASSPRRSGRDARGRKGRGTSRDEVNDWIAGNLCRCTGYRPIVDAGLAACAGVAPDRFREHEPETADALAALDDGADVFAGTPERFFAAPASIDALATLYGEHPDAALVAGATDVGLWITKEMRDLPKIIWLGRVKGVDTIEDDAGQVTFGAAVTHTAAQPHLAAIDPDLGEMMRRFASKQVRNMGTIGGNVANGSPIGDTPPALMALGATLLLQRGANTRTLALEDFFIAYGKQDRGPGEFIRSVAVPKLRPDERFRCYKVSKRFDQDISAVMGAFKLCLTGTRIAAARVAFGGMAATPKRARAVEAALCDVDLGDPHGPDLACERLGVDFAPVTDHRASAGYRMAVAQALLRKALAEIAVAPSRTTRVVGWREAAPVHAGTAGVPPPPPYPPPLAGEGREGEERAGRPRSKDSEGATQYFAADQASRRVVGVPTRHDSAVRHVAGSALYVDDLREPAGTLHIAIGGAPAARGRIIRIDLDAVKGAPGVVAVLTAADIPGKNDVSPVMGDDPMFADETAEFHGQVVFAVVAESRDLARRAVRLARIEIAAEAPLVTVDDALKARSHILPDYTFNKGDCTAALAAAPKRLAGRLRIGGQEHFYLEGQVSLAVAGEDEMTIFASTQHPSELQHIVAHVLGLPNAAVTVEVRRMGGAFGGKESQAAQWAAIAALAARITGRPCKIRLDRDDDMAMTGKRHDFRVDYRAGFDHAGRLAAVDITLASRCGYSADLSGAINDRAMFHADNAYYLPAARIVTRRMKTNTVSNTAFRGFGGPQGMLAVERALDHIAWTLDIDPLDLRKRNLYGPGRDMTPYGMQITDNILPELIDTLERTCDYQVRRKSVAEFNRTSRFLKRGLALTPVKFGISFTTSFLNQAGALVHVYQDGSVHLNHGGTEMGQGLFVKVAQVVAEEFGIDLDKVRITPTTTAKVPNTSATAASSGSDLNGMAARAAAAAIKARLISFAAETWDVTADRIAFRDNQVLIGNQSIPFPDLIRQAYLGRISLSSTGFYRTPDIHWDAKKATGRPFYYFAYGAACSEVMIDTLTGEMKVQRVDILHDVGRSLNPSIDVGQIEGGFVQGMGWLTSEELVFDDQGRLLTHAPSTYKIPCASDVPADFRVALFDGVNRENTIYRSKAVGEPPLMLAISVFAAIADAIHSLAPGCPVPLDAPATPESILHAIGSVTLHREHKTGVIAQ